MATAGWDFDGTNSDMVGTSTTAYDMSGNDFTVGAWVNSPTYTNAICTIAGQSSWQFSVNSSNNPRFGIVAVGTRTTSTLTVSDNTWHFLAVVRDAGTDITFYKVDTDGTISSEVETNLNGGDGGALSIGDKGDATQEFNGRISHVQIWGRTLTAPEILNAAFAPGSLTKNLIGYWPAYGTLDPEPDLSTTDDTMNVDTVNVSGSNSGVPRAIPNAGAL